MSSRARRSRIILSLAVLAAGPACSGRSQPRSVRLAGEAGPLAFEDGPTPLQRQLAAQPAAAPLAPSAAARRLDGALDAFHRRHPSHRAYIAVDKPLYQPGETIWFRGFDLSSAELTAAPGAGITFQLVDPRGTTVIEKQVMLQEGVAHNDFALPADSPGGEYTIKARAADGTAAERKLIVAAYQAPRIKKKLEFLRKAYGPGDAVAAALALHRGTGEPLARVSVVGQVTIDGADAARVPVTTDTAGNAVVRFDLPAQMSKGDGLLTVLVADGGVTESIQKRIPITLDRLQLSLYPEGGDLIAGLPGRVYFAARNLLDKPADVEGRVVDDRGEPVALFRSLHDGLGRFELLPQPGRSYRVEITRPAGIRQSYPLPAARDQGCALQAVDDPTSARADVRVAVWCSQDRTVVATAVLRDRRVATATAAVTAGEPAVLALPAPAGAQGAVRVTLFDDRLRPLAERLVYRNRRADLQVTITADRERYHPRDPVTLTIQTRGPDGAPAAADLALSVVDDTVLSFADDKAAHLLARLYLEAEMPGQKIEEPDFYFSSDPKAPAALDLVLGTHGWRRFDWKPVLSGPPEPEIEQDWAFTGDPWQKPRKRFARKRADADGKDDPAEADAEPEEVAANLAPRPRAPAAPPPARGGGEPMMRELAAERLEAADEMIVLAGAAPMMDAAEVVVRHRQAGWRNNKFELGEEGQLRRIRVRDVVDGDDDGTGWVDWAPVREFPLPNYPAGHDGPRVDFRDTIYWAPRVRTDAQGKATVSFPLSDAVTSFRAAAEGVGTGGRLGRGETLVQSRLPVSLAVTLPLEVASGDQIRLPVTVANETEEARTARLTAEFGRAFEVGDPGPASLELRAGERRTLFYRLRVTGTGAEAADGRVLLAVEAAGLRDAVDKVIKVAPRGFPLELSRAGTVADRASHELLVSDVLPGTLDARVTLYPSPLATMVEGAEAMIAEPGGCFEQASSTNYPNIMILSYLQEQGSADAELVSRTHGTLERGYKLLTGYESPQRGYEWFGGDPGHEALTAYGLLEFVDMTRVYDDVDRTMIDRTASWLKRRRDGSGGYQRNARALDSFGSASPEVTDAYITWALTEAGEKELPAELARQARMAVETRDPYVMALATGALVNRERGSERTRAALARLAGMQAADGSFPGADHSITRSGGAALVIETTALAALALMEAGPAHGAPVRRAIDWLNANRNGAGGYGSTQSTVLSLKAMAAYAKSSRRTKAPGTVIVKINGEVAGRIAYQEGHQGALEIDLGGHIRAGRNLIDIELDSKEPLPYSLLATWSSTVPAASPESRVSLSTRLARTDASLGEGVRMDVRLQNVTDKGIPMALARVGLPGGLTFQTWQLKELRDRKLIDFYETREREVILYVRSMAPRKVIDIPLELKAQVPGTFTAPASRAYLYYTDEHKHWVAPTTITIAP